jgi:hypothetical protein
MTRQDFYEKVNEHRRTFPEIRYGQAVFNVMFSHKPDIVRTLACTGIDPFHHDNRTEAFIDACLGKEKERKGKDNRYGFEYITRLLEWPVFIF